MPATDDDFSKAIILYLGFGSAKWPQQDSERVLVEFGKPAGLNLLARIHGILAELGAVEVNWKEHTLVSGGKFARDEIQHRHPELSDQALSALEWKFTFDWK